MKVTSKEALNHMQTIVIARAVLSETGAFTLYLALLNQLPLSHPLLKLRLSLSFANRLTLSVPLLSLLHLSL